MTPTNPHPQAVPDPLSNLQKQGPASVAVVPLAEQIADAVADAISSVAVAYTHHTLTDFSTAGRSWKVHDVHAGENPFDRGEWHGEFDNKDDANELARKMRRERAVQAVQDRVVFWEREQ